MLNKIIRNLIVLSIGWSILAAGCTSAGTGKRPSLPYDERSQLKDQRKIHAVHYLPPPFTAKTPGANAREFGGGMIAIATLIGIFIAPPPFAGLSLLVGIPLAGPLIESSSRLGAKVEERASLEDPSLMVMKGFVSALTSEGELNNIELTPVSMIDPGVNDLKQIFGKDSGELVLFFRTTEWGLVQNFLDYDVVYSVNASLVRLEDVRFLWSGDCTFHGLNAPGRSMKSWDELTADNGALLKARLDAGRAVCVRELLSQFLGKEETEIK